ncbi:MAG: hypothetical protein M3016_01040 [Actinomycetota bacterium]|nr:hypothetical protein [Actinomycetota bacterium]
METRSDSGLAPKQLSELSALADGTLPESRRAEVQARIAASPELSSRYERERHVVELTRASRHDARAPERLRTRIEARRRRASGRVSRRSAYGAALTAVVAAALLIALVLPGGSPGAPNLSQAAAVAARGPASRPPPVDPQYPQTRLDQGVQDVYFPNWAGRLGWRAAGQRSERVGNRRAVTVYYRRGPGKVAYTIIGAPALRQPAARVVYMRGVALRSVRLNGVHVITWRRGGHTCLLSGEHVTVGQLERLAAWHPRVSA